MRKRKYYSKRRSISRKVSRRKSSRRGRITKYGSSRGGIRM